MYETLPTTIIVNGETLVDKKVYERDWELFFNAILPGRFFMIPMLASAEVKFEHVPQFVPPEEKTEEGADAEKGAEEG